MKIGYFYHKTSQKSFSGVVRETSDTSEYKVVEFDPEIPGKIVAEHAISDLEILPPVKPGKIIAVGLNYKQHASELKMDLPDEPVIFLKPPSAVIPHLATIYPPSGIGRTDYEAELALVIKKQVKNISPDEARDAILGYLPFNDVTARDLQKKDGQWGRAKGFDGFAPIGPFIETDVDPQNLSLRTLVNGEVRQQGHTSDMIFNVFEIVSFISGIMTLQAGDIISTGTPPGVGPIIAGDEVCISIEGMSDLVNYVK